MIGRTLGHYRIEASLGEGGMGVVYKALDTKLNRPVALKVLPPDLVGNEERRLRFQREAQAAAALNHPNICTIHEVGEQDGVDYLVMEYLEGTTLRERIGHKPMPLKSLLPIAIQVGEALQAAHERGVLHRDLKPDNVFVTGPGVAKVLDFGLAKLLHPEAAGSGDAGGGAGATPADVHSRLETISRELTMQGKVFGTVAYMSPEQAKGEPVTHHSDLFSFGVVLYEMATGRQPFKGKTDAETLASIIRDEPEPVGQINAGAPPEFDRIIGKCLEKDLADRYHHADEVVSDLRRLKRVTDSGVQAVRTPPGAVDRAGGVPEKRRRSWAWRAGGGVAALILAAAAYQAVRVAGTRPGGPPPLPRFRFSQVTRDPAPEMFPSLSPDGKSLVYASPARGNWDIYLLRVGGQNPINLTASSDQEDWQPAFSPDGERIAFASTREDGGIFLMGATGESARRITETGFYPAWSPDGRRIAYATSNFYDPSDRSGVSEIWVADVARGTTERLVAADATQPAWSPHGHRVAYWANTGGQRDIWTIASSGGRPVRVTDDAAVDWSPVWAPDGRYLWFVSDRGGAMNLWRVPIDQASGAPRGDPEPMTVPAGRAGTPVFAAAGGRFAFVSSSESATIHRIAFDPVAGRVVGSPAPVTSGARRDSFPAVSPDGAWIAFSTWGEREDIYLVRADGTDERRLTDDPYKDRRPRFSPDGKQFAFYSNRGGTWDIWAMNPNGGNLRRITDGPGDEVFPIWSPDGRRLVYKDDAGAWTLDLTGRPPDSQPEPLPPAGGANEIFWATDWSPDGSELVGWACEAQGNCTGPVVYSWAAKTYRRVGTAGSASQWMRDGKRILAGGNGIVLIDATTGIKRRILKPQAGEGLDQPVLSPDQRTLYYQAGKTEADIWLADAE